MQPPDRANNAERRETSPGRCPATGKVGWATRDGARRALAKIRRQNGERGESAVPRGIYRCPLCGAWHLTHLAKGK